MSDSRNTGIIIAVAVAAVAFVACERAEGVSVSEICEATCEQADYCDGAGFVEMYESMGACRDQCEVELEESYGRYQPSACLDEMMALDLCRAELSCYDVDRDDYGDCDREFDAIDHCMEENVAHYDNTGACQSAEDALNALPCMEASVDFGCDVYDDIPCDYTEYFLCIPGMYACVDGALVYDGEIMDACTEIASELADECDAGGSYEDEGYDK